MRLLCWMQIKRGQKLPWTDLNKQTTPMLSHLFLPFLQFYHWEKIIYLKNINTFKTQRHLFLNRSSIQRSFFKAATGIPYFSLFCEAFVFFVLGVGFLRHHKKQLWVHCSLCIEKLMKITHKITKLLDNASFSIAKLFSFGTFFLSQSFHWENCWFVLYILFPFVLLW